MKRLSFLVLFLLSVFATNVFAESEVSVWGGYTRLDVDESIDLMFNGVVDSFKNIFAKKDGKVRVEANQHGSLNNAFTVGLDYFYGDYENVKPGFRAGYLRSSKKVLKEKVEESYITTSTTASLTSFMPGVKLNFDISEKFSLNGKLFAGIASMKHGVVEIIVPVVVENIIPAAVGKKVSTSFSASVSASEYKFAMDTSVGAQYLLTKKFGLGLDLGYRPFPSDFSGFTATLGLNFKI